MMKFLRLLPILFILLDACIDPLKVSVVNAKLQLVVDGLITDQVGPYQVKIFYSTNDLNMTLRRVLVESNASVFIESDADESEMLKETAPGLYETSADGIQGMIGRSYRLKIATKQGKMYETKFQKLNSSGTLDSVFVSIESRAIANHMITDHYSSNLIDGLKLLVNSKGISGQSNLFRWRWKAIYKAKSFPELRTGSPCGSKCPPDPEPCSGYITDGVNIYKRAECTCCICWATQYNNNAIVSDSSYIQNDKYNSVTIGLLGVNPMLFYDRLYVEVEQLSLSEDLYNFWKLVEKQQLGVGNLFQPNAIKVHGNVRCTTDPKEEVLGVFEACSIRSKSIFFNKSVIPYNLSPIDTIPYDCRKVFLNATTEKPPFW